MNMAINFDSLSKDRGGNSFAPVAPGTYKATITNVELKQSKSGNPMLNLSYDLFNLDTGSKVGAMFDTVVYTENSFVQFKLRCFVEALDVMKYFEDGNFDFEGLSKIINGISFKVVTDIEEFNGKKRARVSFEGSVTGYAPLTITPIKGINAADAIDAEFNPVIEEEEF